ncbi:MAG: hypothetical protein R3F17_13540 [Planctomycetota bacterium]
MFADASDGAQGIEIRRYRSDWRLDGAGYVLLHPDGPELSVADAGKGLLLLDSSWTRLPQILERVEGEPVRRSLPRLVTAYPREGKVVPNPEGAGVGGGPICRLVCLGSAMTRCWRTITSRIASRAQSVVVRGATQ